MALQIRRGPTADRIINTFLEGELVYDTQEKALYVGDGDTAGGKSASTYTDGQAVDAVTTLLVASTGNVDFTFDNGVIGASVTLDGTYNDLEQDTTPQLGGNLDLNSRNITGTGDINITGSVTATSFSGPLTGAVTGNVTGNLTGNADTVTNGVYTSQIFYIGTESISVTRASNAQTLAGVSIGGNAATATKLATSVNINGVAFDGSANISVTDDTKLPLTGGTISSDLTISGNLIVNGETTTLNVATLDVEDLNITIAKGANSALAANGAGITIDGANATITYVNTEDKFSFNKRVDATSFFGPVTGNVTGNLTGDLIGDVYASNGTVRVLDSGTDGTDAAFTGTVTGNVTGNTDGTHTGPVTGDVTGNVTGNITGLVYTTSALEQIPGPHVVIDGDANIACNQITTPEIYGGSTDGIINMKNEVAFESSVRFNTNPVFFRGGTVVVSDAEFSSAIVYSALLPNKSTFNTPVQFAQYSETDRDNLRTIVSVTDASGDGTTATITFIRQATKIAEVGAQIVVTGISPNTFNGVFIVASSTDTSVSFLNNTTQSYVSGGSIAAPLLNGTVIYNTTADKFQGRAGGAWVNLS
jgi:hypothetical protein